MTEKPNLAVVPELPRVDENYEVHDHDCLSCRNLQRQVNTVVSENESLLKRISKQIRQIDTLETSLKEARKDELLTSKHRKTCQRIVDDWKKKTGHPNCILNAKRQKAIEARINEGYTEWHFELAAIGARENPWPPRPPKYPDPMDEIATYAGDPQFFEQFANNGAWWLRRQGEDVEVPFIRKERALLRAKRAFIQASEALDGYNLSFLEDEDLGMALAMCPVCTNQMTVVEDAKLDRVFFDCKKGKCDGSKIADRMHELIKLAEHRASRY